MMQNVTIIISGNIADQDGLPLTQPDLRSIDHAYELSYGTEKSVQFSYIRLCVATNLHLDNRHLQFDVV